MFPNYTSPYLHTGDMSDTEDKQWLFDNIKDYMYLRLEKMFKYKNLPESIPPYIFNMMLMNGGFAILTDKAKEDGTIFAFQGGLGGEPDEYYRPTIATISNPALNFSANLRIGKECVIIRNDAFLVGLDPLLSRYAALMAENIITMKTVDILLRIIGMISAPDDKTRISAEEYLKKLKNGELAVISENRFFEGVDMKSPPANNGSYLTQFIELHQYYKGSLFNELGLQANFNMKRESIGKGEASLSEDILMPLCESMLQTRRDDFKLFNEMYDYNVEVDFDSAWMNNQKEQFYELETLRKDSEETSQLVNGGESNESDSDKGNDGEHSGEVSGDSEGAEDRNNKNTSGEGGESDGSDEEGKNEGDIEDSGEKNEGGIEDSGEKNDEKEQEESDSGEHEELSDCNESSGSVAQNEVDIEINIETGGEGVDGERDPESDESDSDE